MLLTSRLTQQVMNAMILSPLMTRYNHSVELSAEEYRL